MDPFISVSEITKFRITDYTFPSSNFEYEKCAVRVSEIGQLSQATFHFSYDIYP